VRAFEAADNALRTWELQTSDFLRPPEVTAVENVLGRVADLKIDKSGGFPQAERARVFFSRLVEYAGELDFSPHLQALNIVGNFVFDKATHRDFLGAVMGTGLVREKIGDILPQGERGAHCVVCPDVADYLIDSLKTIRSVPVVVEKISLADLGVRPPVRKEVSPSSPCQPLLETGRTDRLRAPRSRLSRHRCGLMLSPAQGWASRGASSRRWLSQGR
jgi:RNA-binding protein YlmH